MATVSVFDAKAQFSALIARAEAGEEIVISRHGRPAVRLVPATATRERRMPGALAGQIWMAPDFDEFTAADDHDWYGE